MRKFMKKACALVLTGTMIVQPMPGMTGGNAVKAMGVADEFEIPAADADGRVGASVPYTRYDSTKASLGGSAVLKESKDWNKENIATQASEQSYVALPGSGAYAEWKMETTGAGVTMRFTLPDSSDGMGVKGSLDVYVNGSYVQTVDLNSYWMWQYFPGGSPSDEPGGTAAFAFDEVHFKLNKSLQKGDTIRIQSSGAGGYEYGVDFLEIEEVPDPIDQPDNSVSVEDYGAYPDDGVDDLDAIRRAVREADAQGMDVYFPEGTYHLSGMWNIGCSDMKITGAGMWYTNIQFTSDQKFGGGISGGNPNAGDGSVADGYCKNLEFCNMYINSNLRSRYGENAVYKCFMDIFADGSVIHDVWEEHFECGFWFGDYNGKMDYCDGVKIVNCRIRNNFADGVNFCMGTSNATVYNCSVRNNGDDGLAMWNNSSSDAGTAHDETNNVFAYNTIDFIWRAGAIAIYGGSGHKIYNNYICDTFMASGIHFNTTFSGYKFSNNTGISFDNNILVRCGTNSDSWGEDLSAIDIKQDVANITFNNTQIYDSPFTAIRLLNDGYSGITFNNTKIYGAGLSGQDITFSCNKHSGVAIRESANSSAVFNGLEIAGITPDKYADDAGQKNTTWPYWTDRQTPQNLENNNTVTILDEDTVYEVPSSPTPDNSSQGGGVVNPLEGITGYDVQLAGLAWTNENGSSAIEEGDKVTFTAAIKNTSNVDIPAGVAIQVKITVDGKGSYTNTTYKGGLKAGETIKLSPTAKWTATAGGHTILATADHQNKLPDELNENNNTREKKFNVQEAPDREPTYTPVTGRYDIVVTKVTWDKEIINVGDELTFTATIVNAGDQAVPADQKLGVQFQIDGKAYPSPITWNDTYYGGLEPGQSIQLTATGGNEGSTWIAETGTHTVTAWADDNNVFGEQNESNNKVTATITVPFGGIQYIENPDQPDDLDNIGSGENPTVPQETTTEDVTGEEQPQVPFGINCTSEAAGSITVVMGNPGNNQTYNIYIDGQFYKNVELGSHTLTGIAAGEHTITLTGVLNGVESAGVDTKVTVAGEITKPSAAKMEINGFQISSTVEGFRTIYSVGDPDAEVVKVGMVYGLSDYASESDMVVDSTNSYVKNYDATTVGKMSKSYSSMDASSSYTMTMKFGTSSADFFTSKGMVRAYAQLSDGTYIYSDVVDFTVYDIADNLYQNVRMNNLYGHDYLYTNILSVVNPNYATVDFDWGTAIVNPTEIKK